MSQKFFNTLVSLVLVATTFLGSADLFFKEGVIPKAEAHFGNQFTGTPTCTIGGVYDLSYSLSNGAGETGLVTITITSGGAFTGVVSGSPPNGVPPTPGSTTYSQSFGPGGSAAFAFQADCSAGANTRNFTYPQIDPPVLETDYAQNDTVTGVAGNEPPTFGPMNPLPPLAHTHGNHSNTIVVSDPEGDDITSVTGSAGVLSITPSVPYPAPSGMTVTIELAPSFSSTPTSFALFATDDVSGEIGTGEFSYSTTDAPLVVSMSFGLCNPGSYPLSQVPKDVACSATGSVTFDDPDDTTPAIVPTINQPSGAVLSGLPGSVFPDGTSYPVTLTISNTNGGRLVVGGTTHNTASDYEQIGVTGSTHLPPEITYSKDPKDPEDILPRMCREVAYGADSQPLNPISASEWREESEWTEWFGTSYGAAGNPPSDGPSPTDGLGDGFSYGDPETDIGLSRPL